MNPRHNNPSQGREATAPYNFVPLPEAIYEVTGETALWQMQDRWVEKTYSGRIELEIEALTPLYTRGAVRRGPDGAWDRREARLREEPFVGPDGKPVIPGSSLRGMVRNLVEILSFSKIQPVSREKPFYRTVGIDRIGLIYRERMVRGGVKPQGGIVKRAGRNEWRIEPCEVLRVTHDALKKIGFSYWNNPSYRPDWKLQQKECFVLKDRWQATDIAIGKSPAGGSWLPGILVLTGSAPKKKREFVFLTGSGNSIQVPEQIWKRFHDDDQITEWQEKAFPRGQPARDRKTKGYLRVGEPVFFVCDPGEKNPGNPDGVVFLGRAQMFRLPYDTRVEEMVPEKLRRAGMDLAEALFGFVKEGDAGKAQAIRSRVRFEDAAGEGEVLPVMVPKLLGSPKPTAYAQYLTQERDDQRELKSYVAADRKDSALRGHKVYWHRWDPEKGLDAVRNQEEQRLREQAGTQSTRICPVAQGAKFAGRVWFENLSEIEVGALLAALQLPPGCAHRIGMGKPLGLGSVRITPKLFLATSSRGYERWEEPSELEEGAEQLVAAFAKGIVEFAEKSAEPMVDDAEGLRKIGRLDTLFRMLEWKQRPALDQTEYLELSRFREKLVLPTPHRVVGQADPGKRQKAEVAKASAGGKPRMRESAPVARVSKQPVSRWAEGSRVKARVAAVDGNTVTFDLGGEEVRVTLVRHGYQVGDEVRVKIVRVGGDGKVKAVAPA